MKILVFTSLYPNILNPDFGVFVRNRVLALSKRGDVEVKVVAPVPWSPPLNISEKWYRFSQIPLREEIDGIEVFHPRYLVTPKVGMSFYGYSMFRGARKLVKQLRENFPFDLIDAHFLYPDGFAACSLGHEHSCPVVVSARGSDVTSYLKMPRIKALVSRLFNQADRLVTVSSSLRDMMCAHGAPPEKTLVIPNGIDPDCFSLLDRASARQHLGFLDEKIVLTVCSLVELKGVHILIEAMAQLKKSSPVPVKLMIVGSGPEKERLEAMIDRLALQDHVRLVGQVANQKLSCWYNAADLFFLGSSREGWPNVVCEALACGTPVVATPVNGIPEILDSEDLGIMVERSPEAFAQGIKQALDRSWDRKRIAAKGQQRTWGKVGEEVHDLFATVLSHG